MKPQNDPIDDSTRDDIQKVLSKYYKNDLKVLKELEDSLNDPEYVKQFNEYIKNHSDKQKVKDQAKLNEIRDALNNADVSDKKEETSMADDTKTAEQVATDSAFKKTANSFDSAHLTDILWSASIKHPYITLGIISGALMLGGIKLTERIVSRGVHMGNMKTLKTVYRMTH